MTGLQNLVSKPTTVKSMQTPTPSTVKRSICVSSMGEGLLPLDPLTRNDKGLTRGVKWPLSPHHTEPGQIWRALPHGPSLPQLTGHQASQVGTAHTNSQAHHGDGMHRARLRTWNRCPPAPPKPSCARVCPGSLWGVLIRCFHLLPGK